jgi:alpha-D-ribose 1-methylphosphonate 5-triphosphate synthase subunit PhnI
MTYVAVKGGTEAIEESIRRIKYERIKHGKTIGVDEIQCGMRSLVDQVMSESSMYSEVLAALSIKQAEGNPEEAVFLMRAYRSTLPRNHYSRTVDTENMNIMRRISASFKDIPGGQILGPTVDYTHRLLDFDLIDESMDEVNTWKMDYESEMMQYLKNGNNSLVDHQGLGDRGIARLPKVIDYLRKEELMIDFADDDHEPDDVTRKSLEFPSSRSQRLQILTRGQTGTVTALGYAIIRGYGALHPTVGELRIGEVPIHVGHPLEETIDEEDTYYIGDICITEAEMLIPQTIELPDGNKEIQFSIGYGACYGQNETKTIAMGILDHALEYSNPHYPTHDEEFVLYHIDSVEATGFISHLKMPHYVTFQSELERMRKTKTKEKGNDA